MSFKDDLDFLALHTDVRCLKSADGKSLVAVAPCYQGRVMTSSANGMDSDSFGWINRRAIASGKFEKHINLFGGEERFWLAPEGGQYSFFFSPESEGYNMEDWQAPALIDTEAWACAEYSNSHVLFVKELELRNRANFVFSGTIRRKVEILERDELTSSLGIDEDISDFAAYVSSNTLTNSSRDQWTRENGLPAIWLLGMFNSSDSTNIVIPFKVQIPAADAVKDDYFGRPPAERFRIDEANHSVYFRADADFRAKIGIMPEAAENVLGSYDAVNKVLTVLKFDLPSDAGSLPYVNSRWEEQSEPFRGDAINSYNDGPNELGGRFGSFYELETLSPGAELSPGESITHRQLTAHFQGDEEILDAISCRIFNLPLNQIKNAFQPIFHRS